MAKLAAMGGKLGSLLISVLLVAAAAAPGAAVAKPARGCSLSQLAELHVTMEGTSPVIETKINGQAARLIVDTGAFFSLVTPRAAERFGLSPVPLPDGFYLQGAVGRISARAGNAKEFVIGKSRLTKVDFLVAGDTLGHADGVVGQNILGHFETEYDLANGVVRLFKPEGCGDAALAYWAGGNFSIASIGRMTPAEPHIVADAWVNDLAIKVLLDTGAPRSSLELGAALRAGASLEADEAQTGEVVRGIGPRAAEGYVLPFERFTIGDETISKTRLPVAKSDYPGADMLLGADFFLSHRVLVSPSQRRLYFTYNGGPVFRLDDPGVQAWRGRGTDPTGQPATEVDDPSALARRAAASAARGDYAAALADLDRAIAAAPTNPQFFLHRAEARLGAYKRDAGSKDADRRELIDVTLATAPPAAALADLDQALKLDPEFSEALLLRGYIRLRQGDLGKADADFQKAQSAAPDKPQLGLQIASIYGSAARFEQAVAHYDAWIAANPKSFLISEALNGRCWARALWGRQLDEALADCDQALKKGRLAGVLDSRGMVRLRRGEFAAAVADYDAALKLQPKQAWSLYGRGLAKLKRGDSAGGAADIQAALALQPAISAFSQQIGLTEESVVVAQTS